MTQSTYLELVKAANTVGYPLQEANQSDDAYIKGLAFAIASIDQEVFDAMSRDAQRWYQQMSQCIKEPFEKWPKIVGYRDIQPQKPVEQPLSKKAGTTKAIRQIIMMNPLLEARQVHKLLDATSAPGLKFETVSVVVSETKSFIILAKELGFWRDKSIYEGQEKLTIEEASTQFSK